MTRTTIQPVSVYLEPGPTFCDSFPSAMNRYKIRRGEEGSLFDPHLLHLVPSGIFEERGGNDTLIFGVSPRDLTRLTQRGWTRVSDGHGSVWLTQFPGVHLASAFPGQDDSLSSGRLGLYGPSGFQAPVYSAPAPRPDRQGR